MFNNRKYGQRDLPKRRIVMKKRFLSIVLAVALVCSVGAFTACGGNDDKDKQAYVSLDINPSIELIVDKNDNVVSVRGENEDGQVLLYEETGIIGEKVDVAVKKITDLAIQYGYLNENNKVVETLVSAGDKKVADKLLDKVNATVTATAEKTGLSVTTDGEGAYSLLRKMEQVKKQFPNNKAVQNMTPAKFRLALSVSETGEITLETAIELDDAELVEMLKEASAKIEAYATEAYLEAKEKAFAVYDEATKLAVYGVYTQFYFEKILSHPVTAYYGGVYQMYASASKGINVICDIAEHAIKVCNYPLNEEQVAKIAEILGLESVDVLKNANGEITVASIEAYVDKLFKNSPEYDDLQQVKAELSNALNEIEITVKAKIDELAKEYQPQIETAVAMAESVAESIETLVAGLPEAVKAEITSATEELKNILNNVKAIANGEKVSIDDLRKEADRLENKANEYLDKINADLSKEELAELQKRADAVVDKMTKQKAELEKAIAEAEKVAKDYLESLKEARKSN